MEERAVALGERLREGEEFVVQVLGWGGLENGGLARAKEPQWSMAGVCCYQQEACVAGVGGRQDKVGLEKWCAGRKEPGWDFQQSRDLTWQKKSFGEWGAENPLWEVGTEKPS